MNKNLQRLNHELYDIYSNQILEYMSWYDNKKYFMYEYMVVAIEQIVYTIEHYMEPIDDNHLLLAEFESLLALIKSDMQKDTWQSIEFSLKSPQRFSKPTSNKRKKNSSHIIK